MPLTISALRQSLLDPATTQPTSATEFIVLHGQITVLTKKITKDSKPYWRFTLADGTDEMEVNVWNDHAAYEGFAEESLKSFIGLAGSFKLGAYGLEAVQWNCYPLKDEEIEALLAGSAERTAVIEGLFAEMVELVGQMKEPVLQLLASSFLMKYREPFCRAAAARGNHHARRGGLVEHTAGMMRMGNALGLLRPELNRDLLVAGALFHDCGKMLENQYEKRGFAMPFTMKAELFGHIAIGVELVRNLWREVYESQGANTNPLANEHVVNCLCHLILSHHGELAYGSPVEPKFPEAVVLHYLDQIDAKLEMMSEGYKTAERIGDGVFAKTWPMKVNLVRGIV